MRLISGFLFVLNCHLVTSRGTDFSVDLGMLFDLQFKATLNENISLETFCCRLYFSLTQNVVLRRHRLKRSLLGTFLGHIKFFIYLFILENVFQPNAATLAQWQQML